MFGHRSSPELATELLVPSQDLAEAAGEQRIRLRLTANPLLRRAGGTGEREH